jgi:hypothetical protein
VIPEGVEYWGTDIFSQCVSLSAVSLPVDLNTIPENMFSGCTNLKSIILPAGLTSIEQGAFSGTGLESIIIPTSVKTVHGAFSFCESLKEITFPAGVETLGMFSFQGCTALETVFIPVSVKEIRAYPFRGCDSLTHVFFEGSSFSEFIEKIQDLAEVYREELESDPIYYYSETAPTGEGNYWHYVDGIPTPWEADE